MKALVRSIWGSLTLVFTVVQAQAQFTLNADDAAALQLIKNELMLDGAFTGQTLSSTTVAAALLPQANWLGTTSLVPFNWYGVTFDHSVQTDVRVVAVDLSDLAADLATIGYNIRVARTLPEGLFNGNRFSRLESLNLSNCKFSSGPVSRWFNTNGGTTTTNTVLRRIILDNNTFGLNAIGAQPFLTNIAGKFASLEKFSANNLREVNLAASNINNWIDPMDTIYADTVIWSNNKFDGDFPSNIELFQLMPNLVDADFSNNQLEGINHGVAFGGNTTLRSLNISGNAFFDASDISHFLMKCVNIRRLNADSAMRLIGGANYFFDLDMAFPTTQLEELHVRYNGLDSLLNLSYFQAGQTAQKLVFSYNKFDTLRSNDAIPGLWYLDLSHNDFRQRMPITLFYNVGVQYFIANNNEFYGEFPAPDTAGGFWAYFFNDLREINVRSNNLTGNIPLGWLYDNASSGSASAFKMDFGNNNFTGVQPIAAPTGILFNALQQVKVDSNRLDFYDLERLVYELQMTAQLDLNLNWQYYPANSSTLIIGGLLEEYEAFLYAPQKTLGIGGVRHRAPGEPVTIPLPALQPVGLISTTQTGNCTQLNWARLDSIPILNIGLAYSAQGLLRNTCVDPSGLINTNGPLLGQFDFPNIGASGPLNILGNMTFNFSPFNGTAGSLDIISINQWNGNPLPQSVPALHIPSADISHGTYTDKWYYAAAMTNNAFPNLTLYTTPKRVVIGQCYDASGAPVNCQQIFVQYQGGDGRSGLTDAQKQAVRQKVGVEVIASCPCGDLELWELSDTTYETFLLANGTGTRQTAVNTNQTQQSQLLSANADYTLMPGAAGGLYHPTSLPSSSATSDSVRVAIIDSGVDYDHSALEGHILPPVPMTGDSCQLNRFGFNFLDESDYPFDDYGHGTNVAGVLTGNDANGLQLSGSANDEISIMPFKYTNAAAEGSLFYAICGMYMAVNNGAKVINASWGYEGEECPALITAMLYAQSNDVMVVCAAGNDGVNNSADTSFAHWPTSFGWPDFGINNLVSVAAWAENDSTRLATYSNYNPNFVHLAAQGTVYTTAIDINGTAAMETNEGTSFAAPRVSRAIALLMYYFPNANLCDIKEALRLGVDTMEQVDSRDKLGWKGRLNLEKAYQALQAANGHFLVCDLSGTEEAELPMAENGLLVYPNPFEETLHLQWLQTDFATAEIRVYSADGRLRYQEQTDNAGLRTISTQDWQAGLYILQVRSGDKVYTEKVIKY